MPEATVICLDTSDFMRNGDFFPSRMSGAQQACSLLIGRKMESNPENTVGFLTMGGKACTVRETLTTDLDRLMASAATINVGGKLHLAHGIQIAQLALSHRVNRRHEARVIVFVGSPVDETKEELVKLGKRLRKDGVAIDVVAFGVEENVEKLDSFVATVDKDNNSHFISIAVGQDIVNSAISGINGGGAGGADGAPAQDFSEYGGVDPAIDPELAMVLRMSLEEERNRVSSAAEAERMMEAGGTVGGGAAAATADAPANVTSGDAPADAPAAASSGGGTAAAAPAPAEAGNGGDRELTEEEQLELALKMSMAEAEAEAAAAADADAVKDAAAAKSDEPDAEFKAALQDEDFVRQLKEDAEKDGDDVNDAPKK